MTYEGEPEDLAEFAEAEFGHTPTFHHPYGRAIARGRAELDQLAATGGSVAPLTQADEIARADTDTSIAIKFVRLSRLFER